MARKRNLFCYLMVAPALILVSALGLYPMLASIRMSFLQYDLMLIPTQGTPFVGFKNYETVLKMPDFAQAFDQHPGFRSFRGGRCGHPGPAGCPGVEPRVYEDAARCAPWC